MKKNTTTLWILAWVGAVAGSNLIVAAFGPAYSIATAFLLIGLSLTSRDFLHENWSGNGMKWKMGLLIVSGGAVSYLIQADAGRIALASVAAFAISETVDAIVYHLLRRRGYYTKVNGSNAVSASLDSVIFPVLAFGGFPVVIIFGQLLAKVAGGALWAHAIKSKRDQLKAWQELEEMGFGAWNDDPDQADNFIPIAIIAGILFFAASESKGASVEHHWDARGYQTTTLEYFRPGQVEIYGFTDFDHNATNLVYGEGILYLNKGDFAATAQVEAGRSDFFDIETVGLFGVRTKGLEALYRSDEKVQFTYVWFKHVGKWTLKGFADIWGWGDDWTVLIEPQAWRKINKHMDVGGELEVSRNFTGSGWDVQPTIAARIKY